MFKKIGLVAILTIMMFSCCFAVPLCLNATENKQSIIYTAFGDSIAEAYAINMKTKSDSEALIGADNIHTTDFVANGYCDLIKTELEKSYTVSAYNFAYSGDTCQNLLDFIYEFYDKANETYTDESSNATYSNFTNEELYKTLKKSNIISVCIGANNILKDVSDLVVSFLGSSKTRAEVEASLEINILGNGSDVKGLKAEFKELLAVLNAINPNAKIYFTNIYNPFKVLDLNSNISQYASYIGITQEKLNELSDITELAIAGGTDSSGNSYVGINNVISDGIEEFNSTNNTNNFKFVDTKSKFDAQYSDSNRANYNQYVNVKLDELELSDISGGLTSAASQFLDPHPTYLGHSLIANAHIEKGLEPYIDTTGEADYDPDLKINNTSIKKSYVLDKGESLSIKSNNSTQTYTYNYEIKNGTSVVKTYTSNPSVIKYADLSAGSYSIYATIKVQTSDGLKDIYTSKLLASLTVKPETFTVSFVPDCDTNVPTQTIEKNNFASKPDVSKNKYEFVGWFLNLSDSTSFDFSTPITSNITLYAKWKKVVFDVTLNYNGGLVDNNSQKVIETDTNGLLSKPSSQEEPSCEDYEFVGWFKDETCSQKWNFETDKVTSDGIVIYAGWAQNVAVVTLDYRDGLASGASNGKVKITIGGTLEEPSSSTIKKDGYEFAYWYLDDENTPCSFPMVVNNNITLKAFWREVVTVNIVNLDSKSSHTMQKGATVLDLYNELQPAKSGAIFLGWYADAQFLQPVADTTILNNGDTLFIRWTIIKVKVNADESEQDYLTQTLSDETKSVVFEVGANAGTTVFWQVNGTTVEVQSTDATLTSRYTFVPNQVGTFVVTCVIDDIVITGKTISIKYTTPQYIYVAQTKDKNNTFVVEGYQYYDQTKLVWFKTPNDASNDFSEQIGTGGQITYNAKSSCKICVVYLDDNSSSNGLSSNILTIQVDKQGSKVVLISIAVAIGVVATIAGCLIIKRVKRDDYC